MPQPQVAAELKYKRARKILQDSKTMGSPSSDPNPAAVGPARPLRLRCVNRDEVTRLPARLEALLPEDHHLARLIWNVVERLDLTAFYDDIEVVEGGPGQAATDPQILVGLWLYATSQGVTSARELDRLCVEHFAYIWLCGGVSMNYHTLSDFRVQHAQALDEWMTQVLGCLHRAGLIEFEHMAQDGIRVRTSAGAASFHRQDTLEQSLRAAKQFLETVVSSITPDAEAGSARRQAAQVRAARERIERLEAALAEMPAVQATKRADSRTEARVCSTDPTARVMKMPDGGFRPAYKLQFATDTAHRVMAGVEVTNAGSDKAEMTPMVDQVQARCQRLPSDWLMDGDFASRTAIEAGPSLGLRILTPVPQPRSQDRDPAQPRPTDSPALIDWRARMATPEAKATYKLRAATSECVNAQARRRHGLLQLPVRGLVKVLCIALWIAITHDLLIWLRHLETLR